MYLDAAFSAFPIAQVATALPTVARPPLTDSTSTAVSSRIDILLFWHTPVPRFRKRSRRASSSLNLAIIATGGIGKFLEFAHIEICAIGFHPARNGSATSCPLKCAASRKNPVRAARTVGVQQFCRSHGFFCQPSSGRRRATNQKTMRILSRSDNAQSSGLAAESAHDIPADKSLRSQKRAPRYK